MLPYTYSYLWWVYATPPSIRVYSMEAPDEAVPGELVFVKVYVTNQGGDGYGFMVVYVNGVPELIHDFGYFASGTYTTVVLSFYMPEVDVVVDLVLGTGRPPRFDAVTDRVVKIIKARVVELSLIHI